MPSADDMIDAYTGVCAHYARDDRKLAEFRKQRARDAIKALRENFGQVAQPTRRVILPSGKAVEVPNDK